MRARARGRGRGPSTESARRTAARSAAWRPRSRHRSPRVKQQRLPSAQLVVEDRRQSRIPALGETRRHLRSVVFLRVVVDVEVLRLEDLEVEVLVLNLVAAEVAALRM